MKRLRWQIPKGRSSAHVEKPQARQFRNWAVRHSLPVVSVLALIAWLITYGTTGIVPPTIGASVDSVDPIANGSLRSDKKVLMSNRQSPSLGLRRGEKLVYSFSQDRTIKLSLASISGVATASVAPASAEIRMRQAGELAARIYHENDEGWVVGFEIHNARFEIGSNHAAANKELGRLSGELKGEMLAFVLKSGRIQKLMPPANMSAEGRNQWKDILARWQVILSDDINDAHWSRTEDDTTGTYLANYSRTATGRPNEISKRKDHYLSIRAVNQAAFTATNTIQGGTIISLNPYPTLIEGREQVVVPDLGISSDVVFSFRLKDAALDSIIDRATSSAKAAMLESMPKLLSWGGEMTHSANASLKPTRPSGNIKTELAHLKQLFAEGKSGTPEEVNALTRIADLIRADETVIDTIFDELAGSPPASDLASALTGVLGAAGTPPAQLSLLSIATSKDWPRDQRRMALFSFAQVTDPIPQVDTWLQWLHGQGDPLANNALLVLAAMGDRLRDSDPLRFNSISQYVTDAAKASDLPLNDKIALLDAIGNLGPREVPGFVRSSLKSDDNLIRQQALRSLQRIQNDSAYNLIMDSIRNDPVESVRAAAVKTLSDTAWQSSPDEFIRLASSDESAQVRREALVGLNQWANENPKVLELIQRVSQRDRSEEIRNLAAQLLASHAPGK